MFSHTDERDGGRFIVCQFYDCCLHGVTELGTETTSWHENTQRLPVRDDVTDRMVGYGHVSLISDAWRGAAQSRTDVKDTFLYRQ